MRLRDDTYYTPDALALAICRRLRESGIDPLGIIEPSAGTGAFVRAARATWPRATIDAIEPNGAGAQVAGAHVTWNETLETFAARGSYCHPGTLILGNPPFSLAEDHVRLALRLLPNGGRLCFLLRASILASQGRVRGLWRQYPPRRVWHVAPRPSFTGGGTDTAEYVVVLWEKGHTGDYAGGWLEWER